MRVRHRFGPCGVGLVLVVVSACGTSPVDPLGSGSVTPSTAASGRAVVVGASTSTESSVLAELYAQAMTAHGVPAATRTGLGSPDEARRALEEGSVSVLPEYTGDLLLSLDPNATATTAAEVAQALPAALPTGQRVLASSPAADQDVYVVTRDFARRHGLATLADLKKVSAGLTLGGPAELETLAYGPAALTSIYGVTVKGFRPDDSVTMRARDLTAGRLQLATFGTTESVLAAHGYVELGDPQEIVLPQNVVPLTSAAVAEDAIARRAVESVQAALTTADLAALDERVDAAHVAPAEVARDWLQGQGLS